MATKIEDAPPIAPEAAHAAAKAKFQEVLKKTKIQEGLAKPDPAPEVETPKTEAPAAEAAPVAPKPKAPKVKKPDPLEALRAEIADLKTKLEAPKPPEPEPEDDDPLAAYRDKLVSRFGEEEATELLEVMEASHRPLREQVKQLQGILKAATESGRANISKSNQKRLAALHPQLASESAWKMFDNQVDAEWKAHPKKYASADEAYDAVATAFYGEAASEDEDDEGEEEASETEAPEEVEEAASRIAAGSMTTPGRAPRKESRSQEDRAREHLKFIIKHPEDKAGAKRLARELGLRR